MNQYFICVQLIDNSTKGTCLGIEINPKWAVLFARTFPIFAPKLPKMPDTIYFFFETQNWSDIGNSHTNPPKIGSSEGAHFSVKSTKWNFPALLGPEGALYAIPSARMTEGHLLRSAAQENNRRLSRSRKLGRALNRRAREPGNRAISAAWARAPSDIMPPIRRKVSFSSLNHTIYPVFVKDLAIDKPKDQIASRSRIHTSMPISNQIRVAFCKRRNENRK